MGVPWELEWDGVKLAIEAVQERLDNPKPVLRQFSRKLIKDIRENIKAGGTGWPPKAASTLAREQATGTSQISKRGTVRSNRIKRTLVQMRRLERKIGDEGWTKDNKKKYAALKKRYDNYVKAEGRSQRKEASQRKIGKRVSESHELLERMPGTIRSAFQGNTLIVYSKANKVGAIHNEGEGRDPKREFIPPPNMDESMRYLKELLESDLGQAWETRKGR